MKINSFVTRSKSLRKMKIFIVLCCLVVVSFATPINQQSRWDNFKLTHKKTYENAEEELKRTVIFYENLKRIDEHNQLFGQGLVSWKMGVNQFTDWTHEEFVGFLKMSGQQPYKSVGTFVPPINAKLPAAIDWRKKGAVTNVKDQFMCASCWAFSAVGSLEGQNFKKTGKLVTLSAAELVDCSKENYGCKGGSIDRAFEYVEKYGLTTEDAYDYDGFQSVCLRRGKPRAVRASGYQDIQSGNETDLQVAVATVGPISVASDASQWRFYGGGVYDGFCGCKVNNLDHGVLVVGYDTDVNGRDYWLLKNSWNKYWGEDGYIRLPRHENKCGVATAASYPLL